MSEELIHKVALVTGASRGIGRAIAIALAEKGADVALNFREREQEAAEVQCAIEKLGRKAVCVRADVSVAAEVQRMAAQIERDLGPVSILVNNAGIVRVQPLDQITEQDWNEVLAVNLTSMFLVSQAVLPAMRRARWGRIINLSSVAAQLGGVVGPHYAASKAGCIGLTHSYATLLAKEGITANAIAPALIETEMVTGNSLARADVIPVGRYGKPEEVSDIAAMLACNGYITGQTFNANGGWYMSS